MNKMKEPIKIKSVDIKNRLVMPPMATSKTKDGTVNQALLDYYDEKSKGGYIGLIITEHNYVSHQGIANPGQMSISQDSDVEGLAKIVSVIHENGSKVIAQINHAGSSASRKVTGMETISASAILNNGLTGRNGEMPTAMSKEQIDAVVADFVSAARRAREAGYDGVEIHSAHGYLLNQFYSPLTNKREDEYGFATMENRLRIHKEIIQGIRAEVGNDYLIALRLGGCDYSEGGSTIEDSVQAAKLIESYGIDLLDVSGGMNGYMIPGRKEPGYFSDMTEQIKKSVSIPVLLTGGICDLESAEELLENQKADLIGVGRAIMKDSLWAKNAMNPDSAL
ncbi:MAG: NADH:flavin oxidoreductase [Eubacteriales bacterium]|nr:NADH:flavin oxidoreductase [Eubacteriales bacterium]